MSGSAESTPHAPDPFAVILGQALLLHQDQMHRLQCQLQGQYQLNAQQQEEIAELKKQLRRMKGAVAHAKSKIKHQSQLIDDLHKRIPGTSPASLLKYDNPPSTSADQSGVSSCTNLFGSPKRKAYTPGRLAACDESSHFYPPETPLDPCNVNPTLHNTRVHLANQTIDRTCVSLFSGSPISLPSTPATTQSNMTSVEYQADLDATTVGATEVSTQGNTNLQTSGSSSSSSNDVIIVGDVTRFYPDHTPHYVDVEIVDSETGSDEEKEEDEKEEEEEAEVKEEMEEGEGEEEEREEGEVKNGRLTSFSSRIFPLGSGACKGLSLRDGTGRFRYKELNRNPNSSVAASTSRTTICDTFIATGSSDDSSMNPSKLPSFQESDSSPPSGDHSSQSSSATSPNSPSILRSSGSPWKQPRSPVVPASTVVPCTRPGLQIPKSDSQLSLDISHTIPLSPELHPTSAKEDNHGVDHENRTEPLDHQDHVHSTSHPRGGHLCKSTKPPIAASVRSKRPKRKSQRLKQATLTQTIVDLPPSTGKQSRCGNKQSISGVQQLNVSISDISNVPLPPTLVLATPGMRPVSNIVGASFHVSRESMQPRVGRDPPKRTLIRQDDQGPCQDLEDVLPCKKARLLDSVPLGITSRHRMQPNEVLNLEETVVIRDDDVTRVVDLPSDNSEEEPSPVFNPPVVGSGDLSSHEPCNNDDEDNSPMNAVAGETVRGGSEDVNLPMDRNEHARTLAAKAGLPTTHKFVTVIRKKSDRDKLDAKPCPECQAWFAGQDGIHRDKRQHLMHTCRHKDLHLPPDSDSAQWEISFPDTEHFERLMKGK